VGVLLSDHSSSVYEAIVIFQSINWRKKTYVMHNLDNVMNLEQIFVADNNFQDVTVNQASMEFGEGIEFNTRCMAAAVWLTPLALRHTPHDLPFYLDRVEAVG
jgi:hypothetical protein